MVLGVGFSGVQVHSYTGSSCLNEWRCRPVTGVGIRSFVQCPERLWKLVTHSVLYFPTKRTISGQEVPSWLWAGPAWGMEWYRQSVLFVCGYFQVILLHYVLKLLKWTPEVSQCYFHWDSCLIVVFVGRWRLVPPTLPSWWYHSSELSEIPF